MLRNAVEVSDSQEKSVMKVFNVISIARGWVHWVGVKFPGKKLLHKTSMTPYGHVLLISFVNSFRTFIHEGTSIQPVHIHRS